MPNSSVRGMADTDGKQCSYDQLKSGMITSRMPQWKPSRLNDVRDDPLTTVQCATSYSGWCRANARRKLSCRVATQAGSSTLSCS